MNYTINHTSKNALIKLEWQLTGSSISKSVGIREFILIGFTVFS